MDQQHFAKAKAAYKIRMSADPRYQEAKRIHDAVMAQHRQRMAAGKPPERHLHVVASASMPQLTREQVERSEREEATQQIMARFHAKGSSPTAEPQTLDEAQAAIMAQFTARKPAALAIRATIKE